MSANGDFYPPNAKGLVFDLDGTVLDTTPLHWAAWKQTAEEHGVITTKEEVLAMRGKPPTAIMQTLCERRGITDVDVPAAVRRKQDIFVALAVNTKPIEMVLRVAKAAKAAGLPVAVATGGTRRQVTASMQAAGVADFFDAIVTCEDVVHEKPHPGPFLEAARLIGVDPALCVGYEDAPLGMEAIERAGFLEAIDVTLWPGYPV